MLTLVDTVPKILFTQILRFCVEQPKDCGESRWQDVLNMASNSVGLLNQEPMYPATNILVKSLQICSHDETPEKTYAFLDNCIARFVKAPVRYYDALDDLTANISSPRPRTPQGGFSPLIMTAIEQLPHSLSSKDREGSASILRWFASWLQLSAEHGGDKGLLEATSKCFQDRCSSTDKAGARGLGFDWKSDDGFAEIFLHTSNDSSASNQLQHEQTIPVSTRTKAKVDSGWNGDLEAALLWETGLPPIDRSNLGLTQWVRKTFPEIVEDNSLSMLVKCLCSEHQEVRKQALISLRHVHKLVQVSLSMAYMQQRLRLIDSILAVRSQIKRRVRSSLG